MTEVQIPDLAEALHRRYCTYVCKPPRNHDRRFWLVEAGRVQAAARTLAERRNPFCNCGHRKDEAVYACTKAWHPSTLE